MIRRKMRSTLFTYTTLFRYKLRSYDPCARRYSTLNFAIGQYINQNRWFLISGSNSPIPSIENVVARRKSDRNNTKQIAIKQPLPPEIFNFEFYHWPIHQSKRMVFDL